MKPKQSSKTYEHYSQLVRSMVPIMMAWAEDREDISPTLGKIGALAFDAGSPRFYPEWYAERRTEHVVSRILTKSEMIRVFLRENQSALSAEQAGLLSHLVLNPATWVYGMVSMEESFPLTEILVEDFTDTPFVVMHKLMDEQENFLLPYRIALVLHNGEEYQTFGYHHSFSAIYSDDIRFFFEGLDTGRPVDMTSITESINRRFTDFLLLDSIAFHNESMIEDEYIDIYWDEFPIGAEFDTRQIPGKWRHSRSGNFHCMVFDSPDKRMRSLPVPHDLQRFANESGNGWQFPEFAIAALFIDSERQRIALLASTQSAWISLLHLVAPTAPAVDPETILDPQQSVSLPVLAVSVQIRNFAFPWQAWHLQATPMAKDLFNELEHVAKSRAVLNEYLDARELSLRFDLDARCKRMDVDASVVVELAKVIENMGRRAEIPDDMFDITTIDGDFVLPGLEPLAAREYEFLSLPLEESELFAVDAVAAFPSFEVLTNGSQNIGETDLLENLEDLFYAFFDEIDTIPLVMMNYLFLLLLHRGRQWTPVRTFAIEVLKLLFPYLKEIGDDDADVFATRFSEFVYRKLRTHAVVEVKERPSADQKFWGTYEVRPTQFFLTLVQKL